MAGEISYLDELIDVDLDTAAPIDGQVLSYDSATGTWVPATSSGGGFDPDSPLDYFTMTDTANGDLIEVTVASGAWVLTTIVPMTTEGGTILATEGGDVLIAE